MMKRSILLLLSLSCTCLQASVSSDAAGTTATRSVVSAPAAVAFNKTAFVGNNTFFLGAGAVAANNTQAVARAYLQRVNGAWTVPFAALADQASVNGGAVAASPLQARSITNMALLGTDKTANGRLPVVTKDDSGDVYLVTNPVDGSALQASNGLHDSGGDAAGPIVGVASTAVDLMASNKIFVAVAPDGGSWNGGIKDRGVALLSVDANPANGLTPANAQAVNLDVTALQESLSDAQPVAFKAAVNGINNAVLGPNVDMVWDQTLNVFYMGFDTITRNANNLIGGVVSVVVGRLSGGNVAYRPIFAPGVANPATFFDLNTSNGIIGFNYDATVAGNKPAMASAYKVRVMHTSTGRSYLIVNGGVIDAAINSNKAKPLVYALPLLDATGQLAQVNIGTHVFEAVTAANMKKSGALDVKVGVSASYLGHDLADNAHQVTINDMQIIGDTVYVSVAGTRDAANKEERGIFASTAIFDQYGVVRAWTPWQRVMGNIENVAGFGFDEKGSNYWYLNGDDKTTTKVTRWDAGADNIHTSDGRLSVVLQSYFAEGGVYGLFNFDDETLGFKEYNPATEFPQFSMMVATGYNRVAMVEMGRADANGVFQQTMAFDATPGVAQNVFIFDATANPATLPALGAITAAEVARVAPDAAPADDKGWLFVGGERGVAVLRKIVDGSGWLNGINQGLDKLEALDYPGAAAYAFKQIAFYHDQTTSLDITNVRKIISDGTYLYILTNNALSRLEMKADTMKNGYLADDNDYKIPLDISTDSLAVDKVAGGEAFKLEPNQDEFFDMMLIAKGAGETFFVIATSKGLIKIGLRDADSAVLSVETVLVNSTSATDPAKPSLGPVLHLDFVSEKRGGQLVLDAGLLRAQGNMYALAIDANDQALNTYRFDVDGIDVTYFIEPYKTGGVTPTDYFYQIGSVANLAPQEFSGLLDFVSYMRHFGDLATYFVDKVPMVPATTYFTQTAPINLNADLTNGLHLGTKVLDTASGAVYVPGQFGVRVNE